MRAARRACAAGAILLLLILGAARAAEPVFPALTGRVVDAAGILSPQTRDRIDGMLAERERASGDQIVVATVASLQGDTIEDFGYRLGRAWGIGQKEHNNGAILLVAPTEHKVRIEVGYGLEDRLTDAQSRIIIEQTILPSFRGGDFDKGIEAGAAAMIRVLGGEPQPGAAGAAPLGGIRSDSNSLPVAIFLPLWFIVFFGIWGVVLYGAWRHRNDPRWRHRSGSDTYFFGGSSGGGSSGGGGFSGGGGSFGGGGASGSW